MNNKKINNRKLLVTLVILIIGLGLISYGTYLFYVDKVLSKVSIEINATIKEVNYDTTPNKITIYYDVKGTRYENIIEYNDEVTVNDKIPIKYNKNNPQNLIPEEKSILALILVLSSAIFLIIGLSNLLTILIKKCHIAFLKKNGILINVDIEGFYINTNAKMINGRHPYKLRASCINSNNGIKYVFESENIYDDANRKLSNYTEKTIPVYLNKKNTYDYYLDTNVIFDIKK